MRRHFGVAMAALAFAGCGKPAGRDVSADATTATGVSRAPAARSDGKGAASHVVAAPVVAAPVLPMLAYSYGYVVEAPAARIAALMRRHEQACEAAGAALCQVTAASAQTDGRDRAAATLSLRAEPGWLRRFRDGLDGDARGAGGRVRSSRATTEDLSHKIVDTEAAIRAKLTLRGRMEQLLATRPGKLSELLELEQGIATLQGEIDATQSELAGMRGRVETSALTLEYEAADQPVGESVWRPLASATQGFVGHGVTVAAFLLNLISYLLPLALLAAAGAWGWREVARRRAARPGAAPKSVEDTPPTRPSL